MSTPFYYLDMELQVLIHGIDVVKDVSSDARNDPHQLGIMELTLEQKHESIISGRK